MCRRIIRCTRIASGWPGHQTSMTTQVAPGAGAATQDRRRTHAMAPLLNILTDALDR